MGLGLKTFGLLLWTVALSVVGITLFTKGFLLNRLEVPIKSSCEESPIEGGGAGEEGGETQKKGCWTNRQFKKAIILIVDALRYDFATFNASLTPEDALPFQNKLPVLHELLTARPENSALFKFLADPPTTTMQRLKGLTTGSLPTFIDVSSNFASSEVMEDNVIQQLAQHDRKVVFMGDDTWTGLYPKQFHKVYAFPSFNVKDLHTVDNGVLEHLVPEMEKEEGEWDVLIGHFLGVDHVGHRFGPYHPTMGEKLTQMDGVIRSVVSKLTDDTMLFVMGDHGMTRTGDHGGDSSDEVGAALFIYSPAKLLQGALQQQEGQAVSQIDFVPTLSLLLGLPIPFSNLGMVIPELFLTFSTKNQTNNPPGYTDWAKNITGVEALRINAYQIKKYLDVYARLGEDLPKDVVSKLQKQLAEVDNAYQTAIDGETSIDDTFAALKRAKEGYIKYISEVKEMCRKVWAKFDMVSMVCGISVLCLACIASVCITMQSHDRRVVYNLEKQLSGIAVGVGLGFILGIVSEICTNGTLTTSSLAPFMLPCLGSFIGYTTSAWSNKSSKQTYKVLELWRTLKKQPVDWMVATMLVGWNACGLGANSFLINEDAITAFLLQSLVWSLLLAANFNRQSAPSKEQTQKRARAEKSFDIGRYITRPSLLLLFVVVVFSICVRLSMFFRACREEQWWCETPHFLKSLSTVEGGHKNARYFFAAACMALIPVSLRLFMSKNGNMDSVTPTVLNVKYALPVAAVCTSLYWAMQALPQRVLDNLPAWEQVILPRVVYVIIFSSFVSIVWKPLCLLLQIDRNYYGPDRTFQNGGRDRQLSKLYNQVKSRGTLPPKNGSGTSAKDEWDADTKRIPAVYGLATVYSAASLVMTVTCSQLVALLLGDGLAPAVLLLLVQMGLYLEFHAAVKRTQARKEGLSQEGSTTVLSQVPWPVVVGWGLMTSQYFFYTGHQAAIPTIRFESAFTGFYGDFDNNLIPAMLIGLNTFASQVLFTMSLPLLLVWPFCRGKWMDKKLAAGHPGNQEVLDELQKGEFVLHEHPVEYRLNSLRLYSMFLIFNIIKLGGTMVSAGHLRNHLMVWNIFAPRYVFEGVSFLVVCIAMLLSYLLLLRVDHTLAGWVGKLRDYCKTQ
ncbi:PIGO [Branchiostoma lanceolatum]|uniref:GPI ethanolamine phosphate transferase 3, catalytic subunit n=1 Tax=Branchiostoma lanceolatum TaxID=7740 RepID=A0A8K0EJP4_BRALA|nr:PIGO [Branchiostoma lanceolatum]